VPRQARRLRQDGPKTASGWRRTNTARENRPVATTPLATRLYERYAVVAAQTIRNAHTAVWRFNTVRSRA